MIDKHLMKLRARDDVSAAEEAAIRDALGPVRDVPAKAVVIRAGERLSASTMLLDGLMCRYKDMRNGERQITELHVSGDFVDLHSFSLKRLDHNIMALTPCRIAPVPHDKLTRITEQHPHLARLYWFTTNLDAAIHREWEVSLGRRTATGPHRAFAVRASCEIGDRGPGVGRRLWAPAHSGQISLSASV